MKVLSFAEALRDENLNVAAGAVVSKCEQLGLTSSMLTIHNALLARCCQLYCSDSENVELLEIGTYDGVNARLLVELFAELSVTTYDVNPLDPRLQAHNPKSAEIDVLKQLYSKRVSNTSHPRIRYLEKSSSTIFLADMNSKYRIIWVDGDHSSPQVCFDIMTALYSLAKDKPAHILCDDVYLSPGNATYNCLLSLEKDLNLDISFYQKRGSGDKYVAEITLNAIA